MNTDFKNDLSVFICVYLWTKIKLAYFFRNSLMRFKSCGINFEV